MLGRIVILDVTPFDLRAGAGKAPLRIFASDGDANTITLTFFNNPAWAKKQLPLGEKRVVVGKLDAWMAAVGWERLLNRQGSTWRALDDSVKASVMDAASAAAVMGANPSCIKRPVVEWGAGAVTVGFSEQQFLELLLPP